MKAYIIYLLIIVLGFITRVYQISNYPPSFYSDEALFGYEAYSILTTGKDQYGNFFPVTFKAFGDYRPGLNVYTTVPFISIFGLNVFATRLPSVIFSTLTILVVILIGRELFKNKKIAALTGFIFAISPWSIQFARMSHETNIATFLVASGILCLIISTKNKFFLIPSAVAFAISIYAYYSPRVFVPLFLLGFIYIYRNLFNKIKKILLLSATILIILLLPMLITLFNSEQGWSRVNTISILGDKGILATTTQYAGEDKKIIGTINRVFHNKIIETSQLAISNFLTHFNPQFLIIAGDPSKLYSTPGIGIIYYAELIFIIISISAIIKKSPWFTKFLILWLVLGILPDTLTRFNPASARIHLILPLASLLAGYGLWLTTRNMRAFTKKILTSTLIILLLFNFAYFLHNNLLHLSVRYGDTWHYGVKEVVTFLKTNQNQYSKIWITKNNSHWIEYLFFLKYPPTKLQKEIVLSKKDENGMGWVYDVDKYHFDISKANLSNEKDLYIGTPSDFPSNIIPLKKIYYLNRDPAFYIVSGKSPNQL